MAGVARVCGVLSAGERGACGSAECARNVCHSVRALRTSGAAGASIACAVPARTPGDAFHGEMRGRGAPRTRVRGPGPQAARNAAAGAGGAWLPQRQGRGMTHWRGALLGLPQLYQVVRA